MSHLWEEDHPYYCNEGNYYKAGQHYLMESWQEFMTEMGTSDPDMNLLFRWDWLGPDAEDERDEHVLMLFFMMQRKARALSYAVKVTPADEPAVLAWLTERAKTITALWLPLNLAS